jgi:hypothetical protein
VVFRKRRDRALSRRERRLERERVYTRLEVMAEDLEEASLQLVELVHVVRGTIPRESEDG